MQSVPRFHLDECLTNRIAKGLRLRDRDCTTAKDAGLITATDEQQWQFAQDEGRVFITADADFFKHAAADRSHHGLIFWTKSATGYFQTLVTSIDELAAGKTAEDFKSQVFFF